MIESGMQVSDQGDEAVKVDLANDTRCRGIGIHSCYLMGVAESDTSEISESGTV